MAIPAARVETRIVLEGQDNASKSIRSAHDSAKGLEGQLGSLSGAATGLGGAFKQALSGDVVGAAGSLQGVLGGGSGGLIGTIGLTAGAVGLVAAAAGGAALAFTKWSSQIEQTRAALSAALGGDGFAKTLDIANAAGAGVDSMGKLILSLKATGVSADLSAEQLTELQARAERLGKDGDEALTGFADAIQKGTTKALKSVGTFIDAGKAQEDYAKQIGLTKDLLSEQQNRQALVNAIQQDLNRTTAESVSVFGRQDVALDTLGNTWEEFKTNLSGAASGPMVRIVEAINETVRVMRPWADAAIQLVNVGLRPIITSITMTIEALTGLGAVAAKVFRGDFADAADTAKLVLRDLKRTAWDDNINAAQDFGAAVGKALDHKDVKKNVDGIRLEAGFLFDDLLTGTQKLMEGADEKAKRDKEAEDRAKKGATAAAEALKARQAAASELSKQIDAEQKATDERLKAADEEFANRLKMDRAEVDADRQMDLARLDREILLANTSGDIERASGLAREKAALETEQRILQIRRETADQEGKIEGQALESFQRAQQMRADAAEFGGKTKDEGADAKERADRHKREVDQGLASMARASQQLEQHGSPAAQAMASLARSSGDISKNWKEGGDNQDLIIGAIGNVTSAFVTGEKEKAAVNWAMESAAVFANWGNWPAMASHGAAATMYGAIATGMVGGSASGGSGSGQQGGYQAPTAYAGGAGQQGGGGTVNYYFGVLGTQQEAALMLRKADASLRNTGFSRSKGV